MGSYLSFVSMCYSMVDEVAFRSFFMAHRELGWFFNSRCHGIFGGERIFVEYRFRIGIFGSNLVRMAISVRKFVRGIL